MNPLIHFYTLRVARRDDFFTLLDLQLKLAILADFAEEAFVLLLVLEIVVGGAVGIAVGGQVNKVVVAPVLQLFALFLVLRLLRVTLALFDGAVTNLLGGQVGAGDVVGAGVLLPLPPPLFIRRPLSLFNTELPLSKVPSSL